MLYALVLTTGKPASGDMDYGESQMILQSSIHNTARCDTHSRMTLATRTLEL